MARTVDKNDGVRGKSWLWLAVLGTSCALFFSPVLFGGQTFCGLNTSYYYYPDAVLTSTAWAFGELPLWEPRVMFGYPYLADPHAAVFYPLSLILRVLPFPAAYGVFVVSHVLLVGVFLFFLLREWGLARSSSAFGAAVLMFCGFTVSSAADLTTLLRGLCWLPVTLLVFSRFLATGSARYVLLAGLTLAIQGSGTDPQFELFTVAWLAVAVWLRPRPLHLSSRRVLFGLLGVGVVTAGLLAYQYLPLAELVSFSDRRSGLSGSEISGFEVNPRNLYNLVLPTPFPNAGNSLFFAGYHGGGLPFYSDLYWGFAVFALAAVSLAWFRPEAVGSPTGAPVDVGPLLGRSACVASGVGGIGLLLSLGSHAPVFSWVVQAVPPLASFRYPAKYFMLMAFAVALCAALGFEGLQRGRKSHWRGLKWIAGCCTGAAALLVVLTATRGWAASFLGLVGEQPPEMLGVLDVLGRGWLSASVHGLVVAAIVLVISVLVCSERLPHGVGLAVIASLSIADLAGTTWQTLPLVPTGLAVDPPPVTRILPQSEPNQPPVRILTVMPMPDYGPDYTVYDQLRDNTQLMMGLQSAMHGYDSLIGYMSVRLETQTRLRLILTSLPPEQRDRLLAALGVQYALRLKPRSESGSWGSATRDVGAVSVQRLNGVAPRAFVAPRATVTRSAAEAGVTTAALLALPGEAIFGPGAAGDTLVPGAVRLCKIAGYEPHRVEVSIEIDGRGLLVLLDLDYPGWEARVDGQLREIHRVAGIFRGVQVAGGDRTVEFTYKPRAFRIGRLISVTTLLLLLVGLVVGSMRSRTGVGSRDPPGEGEG